MAHKRQCFLCGRNGSGEPIEVHHIFGAAYRDKSDRYGLTVDLCHSCHNEPPNGVHHNKEVALLIHQHGQRKAMKEQGWTVEEFVKEFGRNYL